jgi:hypothetical protein
MLYVQFVITANKYLQLIWRRDEKFIDVDFFTTTTTIFGLSVEAALKRAL